MFRSGTGDNVTYMSTEQKLRVTDFFATYPVFSLDEAVKREEKRGR